MKYITNIEGHEYTIEIIDETQVRVNGELYRVDFDSICEQPVYSLLLDGSSFEAYVYPKDDEYQVLLRGRSYLLRVEDESERLLRKALQEEGGQTSEFTLKAPMPGLIVAVPVAEDQPVQKGDVLVILESMKMQNELKAPRAGTVARLKVQPGQSVEQHQVLLTLV
jgi:biotin carboxyl carrier protein